MSVIGIILGVLIGVVLGCGIGYVLAVVLVELFPGLVRKLAGKRGGGWISLKVPLMRAFIILIFMVICAVVGGIIGFSLFRF